MVTQATSGLFLACRTRGGRSGGGALKHLDSLHKNAYSQALLKTLKL